MGERLRTSSASGTTSQTRGKPFTPRLGSRSRLVNHPRAIGRRSHQPSPRRQLATREPRRNRRTTARPLGSPRSDRRIRLSPNRTTRRRKPRRMGPHPRSPRLHSSIVLLPRPLRRSKSPRSQPSFRTLDPNRRLPTRSRRTPPPAIPNPV